jgi:hypothetical protein
MKDLKISKEILANMNKCKKTDIICSIVMTEIRKDYACTAPRFGQGIDRL